MYSLSRGPGDASEWYWMLMTGSDRVPQPLHRAVVQIDVADLQVGGERVRVDGVAVVLRGDVHEAGAVVAHGVVASTVTELQLVVAPSEGARDHLVAQADAEHGRPCPQVPRAVSTA